MYMMKEYGPVPSIEIENGFEMQLNMPSIKYFYVRTEMEMWNRELRQMVTSDYGAIFLERLLRVLSFAHTLYPYLCPHLFVPTFILQPKK